MSLFLGVVLFVFLFVPGILDPFTAGIQEETVATDRVADDLTRGLLGSPRSPGVLNRTCTVWFFEHSAETRGSPAGCAFTGETLRERLDVGDRQHLNISVAANLTRTPAGSNTLCWQAARGLAERGGGACTDGGDTLLRAGESFPETDQSSVTSVRTASLYREDVVVRVVMW